DSRYLDMLKQLGVEGKQKYLLLDVLGWGEGFISDLVERQLVEVRCGKVSLRKWVKPILQKLLETHQHSTEGKDG
ncbi:MAG: hypothetical protein ACK4TI_03840, partial [Nitrososphaerales archaeon]